MCAIGKRLPSGTCQLLSSGFVWDAERGLVGTCFHGLVRAARADPSIVIVIGTGAHQDGSPLEWRYVAAHAGGDEALDFAMLRIESTTSGDPLPPILLGSGGEPLRAFTFGDSDAVGLLSWCCVEGYGKVSGANPDCSMPSAGLVQQIRSQQIGTSATLYCGHSGGPVLDSMGRLIGWAVYSLYDWQTWGSKKDGTTSKHPVGGMHNFVPIKAARVHIEAARTSIAPRADAPSEPLVVHPGPHRPEARESLEAAQAKVEAEKAKAQAQKAEEEVRQLKIKMAEMAEMAEKKAEMAQLKMEQMAEQVARLSELSSPEPPLQAVSSSSSDASTGSSTTSTGSPCTPDAARSKWLKVPTQDGRQAPRGGRTDGAPMLATVAILKPGPMAAAAAQGARRASCCSSLAVRKKPADVPSKARSVPASPRRSPVTSPKHAPLPEPSAVTRHHSWGHPNSRQPRAASASSASASASTNACSSPATPIKAAAEAALPAKLPTELGTVEKLRTASKASSSSFDDLVGYVDGLLELGKECDFGLDLGPSLDAEKPLDAVDEVDRLSTRWTVDEVDSAGASLVKSLVEAEGAVERSGLPDDDECSSLFTPLPEMSKDDEAAGREDSPTSTLESLSRTASPSFGSRSGTPDLRLAVALE